MCSSDEIKEALDKLSGEVQDGKQLRLTHLKVTQDQLDGHETLLSEMTFMQTQGDARQKSFEEKTARSMEQGNTLFQTINKRIEEQAISSEKHAETLELHSITIVQNLAAQEQLIMLMKKVVTNTAPLTETYEKLVSAKPALDMLAPVGKWVGKVLAFLGIIGGFLYGMWHLIVDGVAK